MKIFTVKPLTLTLLAQIVLMLTSCGLADLRPDNLREQTTLSAKSSTKGRAILERMEQAHGGRQTWMAHGSVEVVLHDDWPNLLERNFAMPWSHNPSELRMTMMLGKDNARIEFLNGDDKGHAWGLQQWATYLVEPGGLPTFKAHEDAWFYVPTLAYFFEAPMRLSEAQFVGYGGQRTLKNKTYELVYLTWGSVEPRDDIDQYVAWIDPQTQQLAFLEFTVRDLFGFITAAAVYEGWHEVQGVMVPKHITIVSGLDDQEDVTHRMDIKSTRFNPTLPERFLMPDPSKRADKAAHGEAK